MTSSCDKDNKVELFEMTQRMDFEVKAGLNTVETHFFVLPSVESTYDDLLETTGFEDSQVLSIEPKFARLSTVFGDLDLDFLRLVEVRVFDPFDPDFQREVFYLDPVPANSGTVIRPFPGLSNVKEILSPPTFGIEVRLIFRLPPPETKTMRLEMDFSVFGD